MKIVYTLVFLVLYVAPILSADISGRVISAVNGSPIIGANVYIEGNNIGAATDDRGFFLLKAVPVGNYTLAVDYVGYKMKVLASAYRK